MTGDADIRALDEHIEQERAMEMELLEQMPDESAGSFHHESRNDGGYKPKDAASSFSDDEYDDIFMDLADNAPAEDMDMSG